MINIVSLDKGEILTKTEISKLLNSARSTFQYCRFKLSNNLYFVVDYNKDLTTTIATNCRDYVVIKEIESLEKIFTQQRCVDFMFRWINKFNK